MIRVYSLKAGRSKAILWAYDDSNNRESMLDVTPTKAIKWEYSVDWLDRLVAVKRAEAVDVASLPASPLGAVHLQREYVWDESDNRTFFDDHVAGVTYHYTYKSIDDNGTTRYSDQLEEILIYATAAGHRTVGDFVSFESLEHDLDGNLTKRTVTSTGEEISYEFSEFDRLKRVESDLGGNVTRLQDARYGVDGLRNRKLDKDGNSSEEYGPGIMTSASAPGSGSSNAPSISYVAGHLLLGAEVDGSFVFHLPDALGTVRDVVDDTGAVIKSFEFDEYGNALPGSGSGSGPNSPKTFVGGLSVNDDTADSGLFNMGHRNYSSFLGRFISRDPIGHAGNLNLYVYPNPVTFTDADGLRPESKFHGSRILVRGESDQVKEIIQHLEKLGQNPFGRSLLDRVEARCESEGFNLEISARPKGSFLSTATGSAHGVPDSLIMLNLETSGNAMTTSGYQDLTNFTDLSHELGHVIGYLDDGPGQLNNVVANENPARIENGLPARLEYGRGDFERTSGNNFRDAILDHYGISPIIDAFKKRYQSVRGLCPIPRK